MKKQIQYEYLKYIILSLFAIVFFYPFFWVLMSSFKENYQILANPFQLFIAPSGSNYKIVIEKTNILTNFLNSSIVSFGTVTICCLISAMTAYGLLRMIDKNKLLIIYFSLGIMIPIHTLLIPSFMILKKMGLLNNLAGLILILVASNLSLSIFILTGFMRNSPIEIEEAAHIDGAGPITLFFKIVLPLSIPALATVGILTFMIAWNDYLFSYIIIFKNELKTITQGVMSLKSEYVTDYGVLSSGIVVALIPLVITYILFQKQIIKGMTEGASKG